MLIATKLLKAKFHSLHVKESEILEKSGLEILERLESESDILTATPQPWLRRMHESVKNKMRCA